MYNNVSEKNLKFDLPKNKTSQTIMINQYLMKHYCLLIIHIFNSLSEISSENQKEMEIEIKYELEVKIIHQKIIINNE